MRAWLGGEADAFLDCLEQPPRPGLRVNTLKISPQSFRQLSRFQLEPIAWCAEGFLVSASEQARPGRHPHHAAALYYLQDPSAMLPVALLDVQPGDEVLDACAAPGGKATQIGACLQNRGMLVANEVVRARAALLADNLEQFGVTHRWVVSQPLAVLAGAWPERFDRVLVDAPCSGEGLFRKQPAARQEWSLAAVQGCAARQEKLLDAGARLLRPGGRMVYSTCTFAPEENEAVVARFLRTHPDFELVDPAPLPGLSPGRPDWIDPQLARGLPLARCVRIWPHLTPGEGHFAAILTRPGDRPRVSWPANTDRLPPPAARLVGAFWETTLTRPLPEHGWLVVGGEVYWLPAAPQAWQPLRPLQAGWRIGSLARDRLVPSHALALALRADELQRTLDLAPDAPALAAYLRGEPLRDIGQQAGSLLETPELSGGSAGWVLMTVDGFPLGWGKWVQGVVKNHYPRRLRWR
jgi:NOL1/NOP2/sun family putative RNA methylase